MKGLGMFLLGLGSTLLVAAFLSGMAAIWAVDPARGDRFGSTAALLGVAAIVVLWGGCTLLMLTPKDGDEI